MNYLYKESECCLSNLVRPLIKHTERLNKSEPTVWRTFAKTMFGLFIVIMFFGLTGCAKKSKANLFGPASGITGISGICTQVDNSRFPDNKAYVSLLDQNGNPVTNFAIGNFSITEGGNPEAINEVGKVENTKDILSAVLVLDRSGSMGSSSTTALNTAAKSFINGLGSLDQAEIIDFSDTVRIVQSFTTNKTALTDAIDRADVTGSTAFYDATATGVSALTQVSGRKLIIAMTDGLDNSSGRTPDDIIGEANENGLSVFVVGLNNPSYGGVDSSILKKIADDTGGRYFETDTSKSDQLTGIFSNILKQINNQVYIKFRSLNPTRPRIIKFYVNYDTITTSFERQYSYPK